MAFDEGFVQPENGIALEVSGLWKVFGHRPGQPLGAELKAGSKEEIREKTGKTIALRDVSFRVHKGEFFVVTGFSGCGKSTLVRCILRLVEPASGAILVNGEDVCAYTPRQVLDMRRYTIAAVFSHFGMFSHRSVLDNVAYGLKIRGMERHKRYERAR